MAKKRTLVPYYTKMNQSLDAQANELGKHGKVEESLAVRERSRKLFYARRSTKKACF